MKMRLILRKDPSDGIEKEMAFFQRRLKERSLKLTAPRKAIAEEVLSRHDHFTAEDLFRTLRRKGKRVARATIYRTITMMVETGIIESHDFGYGFHQYEHIVGHPHHDHFHCLSCRRIVEFQCPQIERWQDTVAKKLGFVIVRHTHKIYGICRECRKKGMDPGDFGPGGGE